MKKSYTGKRTSIALDPALTKRIEKVSKKSGMKISTYAQERLKSALDMDELKQTVEFWKKLQDSTQYQKIKQLEGEVEDLVKKSQVSTTLIDAFGKRLDDYKKEMLKLNLLINYLIKKNYRGKYSTRKIIQAFTKEPGSRKLLREVLKESKNLLAEIEREHKKHKK